MHAFWHWILYLLAWAANDPASVAVAPAAAASQEVEEGPVSPRAPLSPRDVVSVPAVAAAAAPAPAAVPASPHIKPRSGSVMSAGAANPLAVAAAAAATPAPAQRRAQPGPSGSA